MISPKQIRILVTGAKGQVGTHLSDQLPLAFPAANILFCDRTSLNLLDTQKLRKTVEEFAPHIIINAAAYTSVDKAESEQDMAYVVNAEVPKILAEISEKNNSLLVHYSTDYVFDGIKEGFYKENDKTNPLNVYGNTKREGEVNIISTGGNFLILRTSWVYADKGHNFLLTILRLAQERKELSIVNDQHGSPTSAPWLAAVTVNLSKKFMSEEPIESGIYHAVAQGETTWFDYARFIVEKAGIKGVNVIPTSSDTLDFKAKRPKNSCLSTEKLQKNFAIVPIMWEQDVERSIDLWLKNRQ